nr:hypothetical protein [Bifidobacterium cuniculi]
MDFAARVMDAPAGDFQYERRFFCRAMPDDLKDEPTALMVQGYFVHEDNYALRVRLRSDTLNVPMTPGLDPLDVLRRHRDGFRVATVTAKGPSVGGTRYEAEREIDTRIGAELLLRCRDVVVKNRTTAWISEDWWNVDVFGGANAPLVIAEALRGTPVTNLVIPRFCVTEVTDEPRFSNDELSWRPFGGWADGYERELREHGPRFQELFGRNTMEA